LIDQVLKKGKEGGNQLNPFSKGVLGFDDYSYKVFNEAIMEQI